MKKKLFAMMSALFVMLGSVMPVMADTKTESYKVVYDGTTMSQNLPTTGYFGGVEPGDTVKISVELSNTSSQASDWYMENTISKIFETSTSMTGSYIYELTITDNSTKEVTTLYTNKSVGGEKGTGLQSVGDYFSDGLEWFYIGNIAAGSTATVNLTVKLDGDTQGNDYMNTLGKLKFNFGVEPANVQTITKTGENKKVTTVKTSTDTGYSIYSILACVSGLLLFVLACVMGKNELKKKGA